MTSISTSTATTIIAQTTAVPLKYGLIPHDFQLSEDYLEWRRGVQESFFSIATPLNITLFLLLATLIYFRFVKEPSSASDAASAAIPRDQPVVFQTFTPRTLLKFNGLENPLNPTGKVYLAVKGKVHDVTSGRNFYGPGGPYENFAGRDATRGLACQSFDEEMLTKDLDGPLDPCTDLDKEQLENLQGWVERFDEKYLVVGKLTAFNRARVYGT